MADYNNPFALVPRPSDFDSTSPMQVYNAQTQMNMAQPFIDMARQKQQMSVQQEQMKTNEFASPQAQQARMSGFERQGAENTAAAQLAPVKGQADIAAERSRLQQMPSMTAQRIAEAEEATIVAKGRPQERLIRDLGNIEGALQNAPQEIRPMLYEEEIRRWQQRNPGAQLPQEFRTYNPENMALIRYASIYTPQYEQKLGELKQQGTNSLATQTLQNQGSERTAQIAAGASMSNNAANIAAQQGKNPAAERVRLTRIINDPKSSPEDIQIAIASIESYASDEFDTKVAKNNQPLLSFDLDMRIGSPESKQHARDEYNKMRDKLWRSHLSKWGIKQVKSPDGSIGMIPARQLAAALAQGYKEIK